MVRKWLLCMICIMFVLAGCGSAEVINLADSDITETSYSNNASLAENIQIAEYTFSPPLNGHVSAFVTYEENVYYAVNFYDYLVDPVEGAIREFEPQYNTQIRCFCKETQRDELLYQYNEEWCVDVTDMCCNGEYLIWEDYNVGDEWSIKGMTITAEEDKTPECLVSSGMNSGELSTITPTITEDKLYWYNYKAEEEGISLYQCDLNEKEISLVKEDLMLATPYEHVSVLNGVCTTYELSEGQTKMQIDKKGSQSSILLPAGVEVVQPICNGEICVWKASDRKTLYVYRLREKTLEKIDVSPKFIFSYGIIDNYIIINCNCTDKSESGMYCYDVNEKEYVKLELSEDEVYLYTFQGIENNVYFEVSKRGQEMEIINIEIIK